MENAHEMELFAVLEGVDSDLLQKSLQNFEELPAMKSCYRNIIEKFEGDENDRSLAYYLSARSALAWFESLESHMKACLYKGRQYFETFDIVYDIDKAYTLDAAMSLNRESQKINERLKKILFILESEKLRFQRLRDKVRENFGSD